MTVAEAVVPQPWSTYSAVVCIAVIVLGGIASLIVALTETEGSRKHDVPEED